jgi:ABC-type antimicrobial peptide transport system permease subunit
MIKHILKILWNQRKQFWGIIIEQIFVFIILMLCITSLLLIIKQYKKPGILDTENVMVIGYMATNIHAQYTLEDEYKKMNELITNLKKNSNIIATTESPFLTPYMRSDDICKDSIFIDNVKINIHIKFSDLQGINVFKPYMEEGNWLIKNEMLPVEKQVIISRQLADAAKWNQSIGKKINIDGKDYTVVGVISGIKQTIFSNPVPAVIISFDPFRKNMMNYREIAVRVKNKKEFSALYYKESKRLFQKNTVLPIIYDLEDCKDLWMKDVTSMIAIQTIPTIFLFVFVFIGTCGIFWLNSKKRIKEFALRMAFGSTQGKLLYIVIFESIIISLIAMIPGLILSYFIYDFTLIHIAAIVTTSVIMIFFSIISAWYPAWKVSRANPAEALQYE